MLQTHPTRNPAARHGASVPARSGELLFRRPFVSSIPPSLLLYLSLCGLGPSGRPSPRLASPRSFPCPALARSLAGSLSLSLSLPPSSRTIAEHHPRSGGETIMNYPGSTQYWERTRLAAILLVLVLLRRPIQDCLLDSWINFWQHDIFISRRRKRLSVVDALLSMSSAMQLCDSQQMGMRSRLI